ncbi:hypothetical protein DL96DRAFT_568740 [Flagelloscypha sp. PMI_526]|nr:hypothetical protein DL96DRAFT_568740 [Flagelloscypha sp. PMI_526]
MLPQDLIAPIVKCLDPSWDKWSLRAWCLVNMAFAREAQPHLFSHLDLRSFSSGPRTLHPIVHFHAILRGSPHIGAWVVSVRMTTLSNTSYDAEVFESFVSIRSLWFDKFGESWSKMSQALHHVFQNIVFPRLRFLSADFLVPGLLPWNHISSLRLSTERAGRWIWTDPLPLSGRLKVDNLELDGNAYYQFDPGYNDRFFLWKFLNLQGLKSLKLSTVNTIPWGGQTVACYRTLLSTARMSLTSLIFGESVFIIYNWNEFNGIYDFLLLDSLEVLEDLTVNISTMSYHGERCLAWLSDHFHISSVHPLKRLSLSFCSNHGEKPRWKPDWQHSAWAKLDAALQQDALRHFQSLDIRFESVPLTEELRYSVDGALPESCSRGFVELRPNSK